MSDPAAATTEPSLASRIDRQKAHPLTWQWVVKRAAVVAIAGVSIYLVFPTITEVLASWPYRLASYWAPLCAGPIAYGLFRIRYRGHASPPQTATDPSAGQAGPQT